MNLSSFVALGVLALAVLWAMKRIIKDRKAGRCPGCSGGQCECCSENQSCSKLKERKEQE